MYTIKHPFFFIKLAVAGFNKGLSGNIQVVFRVSMWVFLVYRICLLVCTMILMI